MSRRPKLILLGGFAGSGKSTIARKYIDAIALALVVEGDEIITNLGQWRTHATQAAQYKISLTANMAKEHLRSGNDVVLPFLLLDTPYADVYENAAREVDADFQEVLLLLDKKEAVTRLFERGTWGESGLPPITENDRSKIEGMYDTMIETVEKRPRTIIIDINNNSIDETFEKLVTALGT